MKGNGRAITAVLLLASIAGVTGINISSFAQNHLGEAASPVTFLETNLSTNKMEDSGKTEKLVVIVNKHFSVPYESATYHERSLMGGEREIKVAGENGERVERYEVTYENGQETGRILVSSEITKQPVMEIIAEGEADSSLGRAF